MVGIAKSFGILLQQFVSYFNIPVALGALIMGVSGGIYTVTGKYLSCVMRKPAFCIILSENKDADQLHGKISFAVTAKLISTFVFTKYEISSL